MVEKKVLDAQVAVLASQVSSIKEKQIDDNETLDKILENTHQIMLCQEGTKGKIALINKSMENNIRETSFIREKMSSKADKSEVDAMYASFRELRNGLNAKIRRIWRFVWAIPTGIGTAVGLFTMVYEVFFKN